MTDYYFGEPSLSLADSYGECSTLWRVNRRGCQFEKLQNTVGTKPVEPEIRGVYSDNSTKIYYSKDYFNNTISKYKTYVDNGKVKSMDFYQIPRRVSEIGEIIPAESLKGKAFTIIEGLPLNETGDALSKAKLCLKGVLNSLGLPEIDLSKSFVKSTEGISNIAKRYLKYIG